MEKKILHTFRVLNSLFHEARFVYKTAPRGAEDETRTDDTDEDDKDGKPDDAEKIEVGEKIGKAKVETKMGSVKNVSERRREQLRKAERLPRRGIEVDTEEQRKQKAKDEEAKKKFKESIEVKLPVKEFLEKDATEQTNKLDWLRIDTSKINAQTWDHSTTEGLDKIKKDFVNLGIMNYPKDAEYYGTMFAVLYGAADKSNPYFAENNGEYIVAFKDSLSDKSKADISGLAAKGNFLGGEAYLKAFESLTQVRARAMVQDTGARNTRETQSKQGVDPIGTTAVDFVKSNISVLQKAARDRDYSTLGIYAVGAYALWKTVGAKLFGGGGHGDAHGAHGGGGGFDIKTWAMWGAAIYGADKLLKNAGYDVLKMAGFKDMNSEVKGTPMESMQNILSQSAVAKETADLDYGIVLKMSEQKLTDLDSFLKSSKTSGVDKFIHPREFPDLFPDLKNAWPFKKDQDINKPGDAVEREYARVGHQLYKLALALPVVYEKTLFKDHPKYTGLTYEMMLTDPGRSDLRVWKLLEAARQYAPESVGSGFLSGKKPQEIKDKMLAGTDKVLENNGFTLDNTTELKPGSGHIAGHLKGFPIVVVAVKEGYRIYLQSDYNDKLGYNATPGTKFKFIPLEGGKRGAEEAVKKVEDRMGELLKKLQEKNKNIGGLTYESGEWKATTKFKGAADLGVTEKENASTIVKPDELGQMLILDGETSAEKYVERNVLGRLIEQREFKALGYFATAGKLKIDEGTPEDGLFKVKIGKKGIEAVIKYDKDSKQFSFEPSSQEQSLLKGGSGFAEELGDVMKDNQEMVNVTDSWKKLIENAPESYFFNLFQNIPEWFTKATLADPTRGLGLKGFTGSIPKNYTLGLIETQKALVISKLVGSIESTTNLGEVADKINTIYTPALKDLEQQRDIFSAQITQKRADGDHYTGDDFKSGVFGKISEIGIQSNDYKSWYRQFVDQTYAHYGMDDLRKGNAVKAADLVKVFSYYTSAVDDPSMDGANLNLSLSSTEKANVDILTRAKKTLVDSGKKNPTSAEIIAASGSTTITEDFVNTTFKEYEKAEKYKNHSQYVDYVVGQINLKRNQDLLNVETIPAPGSFWAITNFKDWIPKPSAEQFVDTREVLTSKKDFVEFDEYLNRLADTDPSNDNVPEDKIILPRHSCPLSLPAGSPQRALFKKLLTADGVEKNDPIKKLTKLEEAFQNRMRDALDQLESKFKGNLKDGAFSQLRLQYQLHYNAKGDDTNTDLIHYEFGLPDESGTTFLPTSLAVEIQDIENKLSGTRTVTRGYQEELINARIYRILEQSITDKNNFDTYFERTTVPGWVSEKWDDFKLWLFG